MTEHVVVAEPGSTVTIHWQQPDYQPTVSERRTGPCRCDKLESFLWMLRRGYCWCGVGIDDPNYRGRHSQLCLQIQAAVKETT